MPDFSFIRAGYPVIGVCHDYEIAKYGLDWFDEILNQLRSIGFNKFLTLRELVGYLCSDITANLFNDKIFIEVDISNTGGIKDKHNSRYFFNNPMEIFITLPENKYPDTIEIEGKYWHNYNLDTSGRNLEITLPPFQLKDKQTIVLSLTNCLE